MQEDNIFRITDKTNEINIITSKCEQLAKEIYFKLSPFGLHGRQGILRDILPMQNLEQILITNKYIFTILEKITEILNNKSELTNKIKYE